MTKVTEAVAEASTQAYLQVSSFAQRFCRAGRYYSPEPVLIPLAELSEEELAQLEGEINLKTQRI